MLDMKDGNRCASLAEVGLGGTGLAEGGEGESEARWWMTDR